MCITLDGFFIWIFMCITLDGFYGFSISQILMARGLLDEQSDIVGTYSIEASLQPPFQNSKASG